MPRAEPALPSASVHPRHPLSPPQQQALHRALRLHGHEKGPLLPALHAIQEALGHIPAAVVAPLASALQLSRADVQGVISFYPHFRQQAPANLTVAVCRAEACQAMNASALFEHACAKAAALPAGTLHIEPVYCLGLCAQGPAALVNQHPHARLTPSRFDAIVTAELSS